MHSDHELLELAARAAGFLLCGYSWIGENEDDEECEILEAAFVKHHQEQELASKWNPLTDDGDALRLAVKLGLRVKVEKNDHAEVDNGDDLAPVCWQAVANGQDIYVATRRAIVRAASQASKAADWLLSHLPDEDAGEPVPAAIEGRVAA